MRAAYLQIDVVDLPGEAVRRKPLGHGMGIGKRAKAPFGRAMENAVKTNGARHARLLSVGIVLLCAVDRRLARSTSANEVLQYRIQLLPAPGVYATLHGVPAGWLLYWETWPRWIERRTARSRRQAREHRGILPFRVLRRGLEPFAKIHRERVGKDVFLPGLDAVEDRKRYVARRGLRHRKLTGHVGVNGARVDAEDRGALSPEEHARGLGQRMERGLRSAVGRHKGHVGQAGRRADVDDRAPAIPGQRRRQALQQLQRAEVVHLHLAPREAQARRIRDSVAT